MLSKNATAPLDVGAARQTTTALGAQPQYNTELAGRVEAVEAALRELEQNTQLYAADVRLKVKRLLLEVWRQEQRHE